MEERRRRVVGKSDLGACDLVGKYGGEEMPKTYRLTCPIEATKRQQQACLIISNATPLDEKQLS